MDTKTNDPNHLINDSANEERILKRPRSVPREIKGLQDSYIYQYQNNRENPRPRTNFEIDERTPFNRLQALSMSKKISSSSSSLFSLSSRGLENNTQLLIVPQRDHLEAAYPQMPYSSWSGTVSVAQPVPMLRSGLPSVSGVCSKYKKKIIVLSDDEEEEECLSFSPKSADKAEEEECLSSSPQSADLHFCSKHKKKRIVLSDDEEEEECPSFSPKSADKAEEEECLSISPQSADLHLSVSHDLSPVKHLSAAPSSSSELELLITDQEGKKGHSFDIEMKSLRPYLSFFKNKILPSKRPRIPVSYYKETAAVGANKLTAAAVVTLELTLESQRAYFEASHPEMPPICLSGSVSFSSPSGSDGSA